MYVNINKLFMPRNMCVLAVGVVSVEDIVITVNVSSAFL